MAATQLEYALMAGAAYRSTRNPINRIPIPEAQGWRQISYLPDPDTGFEAISFQRGTEIVISFAGTGQPIDVVADLALVLGSSALQLKQAALYYEQIKAANPDAQISFTGHSLGGGLAALMGVFFNKLAFTFDQLPVRSAASMSVRDSIASYLLENGGITDPDLASFTSDIGFPDGVPPGIRGEDKVAGLYVEGEAASYILGFKRIGAQGPLPNGNSGLTDLFLKDDLHAQALLVAFEQHDPFRAVTEKLPNLLRLIFDSALYDNPTSGSTRNFLEHLVRHQAGVPGSLIVPDNMLVHFTNDMQDIVRGGGDILANADLNRALIAFGLQAYYLQDTAFTQEAFNSFIGGVHFDRALIPGALSDLKGYGQYFLPYLTARFSGDTLGPIKDNLPNYQDWYLAGGAADASAGPRAAFMLGSALPDRFTGSAQNDLLVGDTGNDTLQGNAGNDTLYGGTGTDIYKYRPNDGNDVIVDEDKQGLIVYDPVSAAHGLAVGLRQPTDPAGQYKSPDNAITYQVNGADLQITTPTGVITVQDFAQANNDLNIRLIDLPTEPPSAGLAPITDITTSDTLNTYRGTAAAETTAGSGINDDIFGNGGGDRLDGGAGEDRIETGGGNAYADGGSGRDIVLGAGGDDHLIGGPTTDPGVTDDDALQGGDSDDYLEGGFGNDVLAGGNGRDILIGGDGHDILRGAATLTPVDCSWNVDRWPDPVGEIQFNQFTGNLFDSPDNAGDVMYGGKGLDELTGGQGDDLLYGEEDNDSLHGNGGADALFGGQGIDVLEGGYGDDLLFGGAVTDFRLSAQPLSQRLVGPPTAAYRLAA